MKKEIISKSYGKVYLEDKNFIASGGEASIYKINNKAFKLYFDVNNCIKEGKIKELSVLKNVNIIKPEEIGYSNNLPSGYFMRLLDKNSITFCELIPPGTRSKHNLDLSKILNILKQIEDIIKEAHKNNILLVDINELNILVNKNSFEVYYIDCDSVKTPSFPATALMDSIRDRQHKDFFDGTDWFSYAILAFQLFTGIGPYKGKHSTYKTMEERMLYNISILDKSVSYPANVISPNDIPPAYKSWFNNILGTKNRPAPPDDPNVHIIVSNYQVVKTMKEHKLLLTPYTSDIVKQYKSLIDTQEQTGVYNWGGRKIERRENSIYEHEEVFFAGRMQLKLTKLCDCLPLATTIYQGLVIQNILGSHYALFSLTKGSSMQVRLNELKGWKILNARYSNQYCIITAHRAGSYNRFTYYVNKDYSITLLYQENVDTIDINFAVHENGTCALLDSGTDEFRLFSNQNGNYKYTSIFDNTLNGTYTLTSNADGIIAMKDDKSWKVKML